MKTRAAFLTVARIVRPHGRRGEVAAEVLTDFPQRLIGLESADLYDPERGIVAGGGVATAIRSCWLSHSRGGQAIFLFEGSDSIDQAKRLVGLEVQIPLRDRAPVPKGSYYVGDLEGCQVVTDSEASVGRVRQVQFLGRELSGTPILIVSSPRGDVYIPLAADICKSVDTLAKRIVISPPEGLLELNL